MRQRLSHNPTRSGPLRRFESIFIIYILHIHKTSFEWQTYVTYLRWFFYILLQRLAGVLFPMDRCTNTLFQIIQLKLDCQIDIRKVLGQTEWNLMHLCRFPGRPVLQFDFRFQRLQMIKQRSPIQIMLLQLDDNRNDNNNHMFDTWSMNGNENGP